MVTVLPRGTRWPASGDWLNTQDLEVFGPVNVGTRPAAMTSCLAIVANTWVTSGTSAGGGAGSRTSTENPPGRALPTRTVTPASDVNDAPGASAVGVRSWI